MPAMLFDGKDMPCAFAMFTSQQRCDRYLRKRAGKMRYHSARIGRDVPLGVFQGWHLQYVLNFFNSPSVRSLTRKEFNLEELTPVLYLQMPVYVDPGGPRPNGKPAYPNLHTVVAKYFTELQLMEATDKSALKISHLVRSEKGEEFTLAQWERNPIKVEDGPLTLESEPQVFAIVLKGDWTQRDHKYYTEGHFKLGESAHITENHPSWEQTEVEAIRWINSLYEQPEKESVAKPIPLRPKGE